MLLEGAKIIDYCLFNHTVEGALIDQKAQKFWPPSEKQLRSATDHIPYLPNRSLPGNRL